MSEWSGLSDRRLYFPAGGVLTKYSLKPRCTKDKVPYQFAKSSLKGPRSMRRLEPQMAAGCHRSFVAVLVVEWWLALMVRVCVSMSGV